MKPWESVLGTSRDDRVIFEKCPKCGTISLVHTKTTREDAGFIRAEQYSGGRWFGKSKLVRETKHYECKNCDYKRRGQPPAKPKNAGLCPECKNKTLIVYSTAQEKMGIIKRPSTSIIEQFHGVELIHEVRYYKCLTCGHTTSVTTTKEYPE